MYKSGHDPGLWPLGRTIAKIQAILFVARVGSPLLGPGQSGSPRFTSRSAPRMDPYTVTLTGHSTSDRYEERSAQWTAGHTPLVCCGCPLQIFQKPSLIGYHGDGALTQGAWMGRDDAGGGDGTGRLDWDFIGGVRTSRWLGWPSSSQVVLFGDACLAGEESTKDHTKIMVWACAFSLRGWFVCASAATP